MTPEERQMLAGLFERIKANGSAPRDAEAESFINDAVRTSPFAPYVLAQTTLVQQHALEAAAHRIAELEAQLHETAQQQGQGSFLGNLGRSIFGGGAPSAPPRPGYEPNADQRGPAPQQGYAPQSQPGYAPPPPPPPQYAVPRPGPWGGSAPAPSGGGGFLQNAASTAAGVAGGVALGNLLGGLFSGHSGGGLFGGGGLGGAGLGGGVPTETINNFYEVAPDGSDSDRMEPSAPDDAGFIDDSSFDDGSGGGGYDDV